MQAKINLPHIAKKITLVGFGLLAGSIASAIKQAKLQTNIRVVSSKNTIQKAKELLAADEFFEYEDVNNWLPGSDLILLCSPIKHILQIIDILKNNSHLISEQVVVSDIGSTKEQICAAGFTLPSPFIFIGGHPMAGSEKNGFEHSDPSIFENSYWLYCLPKQITDLPICLNELLTFLGCRLVQIKPEEHDFVMAWLSHAPQLLSTSITTGLFPQIAENHLHLAGRGFRDMTRIAGSHWGMWKDILETNKNNISNALNAYTNKISKVKDMLNELNQTNLEQTFKDGNKIRHNLETGKNYAYPMYEIVADIPDEPGSILKALNPIAANNINIKDVYLMKVREGIGGTLFLTFKNEADANNAIRILENNSISAKKRV